MARTCIISSIPVVGFSMLRFSQGEIHLARAIIARDIPVEPTVPSKMHEPLLG